MSTASDASGNTTHLWRKNDKSVDVAGSHGGGGHFDPQQKGSPLSDQSSNRLKPQPPRQTMQRPPQREDEDEMTGSEEDDDTDEDEDETTQNIEGAYNPEDYANLEVEPEIQEMFSYIKRYVPQTIELENRLKPFIPDFIPAVGDIDAFIKVPRPDHKPDQLGLKVLDEPSAGQSDPTVLDLQLRAVSKRMTAKQTQVSKVENADKNPRHIDKWISSISELHATKKPSTVHYSKPMPDIETLMTEWPPEIEEMLKEISLPTAELDCDLATFSDVCCKILDIPVHKNRVQSLHILFTLYSAFTNSQHFRRMAEENNLDNTLKLDPGF